jgi:hypothetical protein
VFDQNDKKVIATKKEKLPITEKLSGNRFVNLEGVEPPTF